MKNFPVQILGKPVVQKTYLVFAFNKDQMIRWCREKSIAPCNAIYVWSVGQVRGWDMSLCEIVDLGGWYGQPRKVEARKMAQARQFNQRAL